MFANIDRLLPTNAIPDLWLLIASFFHSAGNTTVRLLELGWGLTENTFLYTDINSDILNRFFSTETSRISIGTV